MGGTERVRRPHQKRSTRAGWNLLQGLVMKLGTRAGFTLIELLVVTTLIVILAGTGLAMYSTSVTRAREATLKEDLFRMRDAIDQYHADKGSYPPALDALVSGGYLRKVPDDPFTQSADTWVPVPAEPDPNNPVA